MNSFIHPFMYSFFLSLIFSFTFLKINILYMSTWIFIILRSHLLNFSNIRNTFIVILQHFCLKIIFINEQTGKTGYS